MVHHAPPSRGPLLSCKVRAKKLVANQLHSLCIVCAGRMQDNEPLMRALSSLLALNTPDLVLFVGEALVGNDAVDQLSKFNSRLADLSRDAHRGSAIDGILLTKFDTIDEKVGSVFMLICLM